MRSPITFLWLAVLMDDWPNSGGKQLSWGLQNIIKLMASHKQMTLEPGEQFTPMNKNVVKNKAVRTSIKIRSFNLNVQPDIQRRDMMILPNKKQLQRYEVPSAHHRYSNSFVKNLVSRTNSLLKSGQKRQHHSKQNLSTSLRLTPRSRKYFSAHNPQNDFKEVAGTASPKDKIIIEYMQKIVGKSLKFQPNNSSVNKSKSRITRSRQRRTSTPDKSPKQAEGETRAGSRYLKSRPTTSSVTIRKTNRKNYEQMGMSAEFLQPW